MSNVHKIPFAVCIPSLVSLRTMAREQCPIMSPEFLDSIAILAQSAYEDYSDWITNGWPGPLAVNPATFKRNDVLGLATAYLNHCKEIRDAIDRT